MSKSPGSSEQAEKSRSPRAATVGASRAAKPAGAARPANGAAAKPAAAKTAAGNAATAAAANADPLPEDEPQGSYIGDLLRDSPSWLTSLIVHMALLLLLALWMLPGETDFSLNALSVVPNQAEEDIEEIVEEEIEKLEVDLDKLTDIQPQVDAFEATADISPADDLDAAAAEFETVDIGLLSAPENLMATPLGQAASGSGLSGRGSAARKALVAAGGGTPESEKAVAMALRWLAEHQMPDGGWSFDHRVGPCQGRCADPGTLNSARTAATAMAVLPFLGAGQTHKEGEYQRTVAGGLYFLVKSMKVSPNGGDLRGGGGSLYAHGLASIALCEAYAMTQDRSLMAPAQAALNFIVYAQDPVGGGWRYNPKQAGDTSVVGWQVMALKSGHLAYLQVPPNVIKGASVFLDSVQTDSGAGYGYSSPGKGPATSAIGLLCRMYLGWKKDHPGIQRGVENISKQGRSNNMYYNYYAAQVMFQATSAKGDVWKTWNDDMRNWLVGTQVQDGHAKGSWIIKGDRHGDRGGRLYCTSMATMILEVYYRHMPIFRESAVEEEFPL